MRNLKKILAMALALVMSLSLMATAGAANFTDADSINEKYETAVEVLEGLGVFKGYQEGSSYSFKPTEPITRAETAAIIYRIVTGDVKDEQVGIYADYNLFTDVSSTSWYAGYVNYCANAEYIKGVGGKKFDPNSHVTGYAALAMILRAIGYTANGGFTGSDWEVQTARTGEYRKITKNILTGTLGVDATRETVAEILYQAIMVNMVDHNVDYTYNGQQGYTEKATTLGQQTFGLEKVSGVILANEWANLEGATVLAEGKTKMVITKITTAEGGTVENMPTLKVGEKLTLNAVAEDDMQGALDAVGLTYDAHIATKRGNLVASLDKSDINRVAYNKGEGVYTPNADNNNLNNATWKDVADLADDEGLRPGSPVADADGNIQTQYFINYEEAWSENCQSDYRISYAIAKDSLVPADGLPNVNERTQWKNYIDELWRATNNGTIPTRANSDYPGHYLGERTIKIDLDLDGTLETSIDCWVVAIIPGNVINKVDQSIMQEIFYTADRIGTNGTAAEILQNYAVGEVYVGTTSMTDYSDTMSWKDFRTTYFHIDEISRTFDTCEIGNSLRVISNDGDNIAEYVLKIEYAQDKIVGSYKNLPAGHEVVVADYDYLYNPKADEITQGTVVNYTEIDDKLYIWPAPVVTDKITNKNFQNITVTTASGETYNQSGIDNYTQLDENIMLMDQNIEYKMYMDVYAVNIRSYELAQGSNYALLTEMYPTSEKNGNHVYNYGAIAEVKIGDADVDEYPVAIGTDGLNSFFNRYIWTWGLRTYFGVNAGNNNSPSVIPGAQILNANYLQPAVAHLSRTAAKGAAAVNTGWTDNLEDYRQTTTDNNWYRAVAGMKSYTNPANGTGGAYGVFNYDGKNAPDGRDSLPTTESFSFTNVAAYVDVDGTLSLSTVSKLSTDTASGAQIYRVGEEAANAADPLYKHGTEKQMVDAFDAYLTANKLTSLTVDGQTFTTGQAWFNWFIGTTYRQGNGIYPVYSEDYVQLDLTKTDMGETLDPEDLVVKPGIRHFHIDDDYDVLYNTNSNDYVDATVDTEFYIVLPGGPKSIIHKVGYADLPQIQVKDIRAAYAVAHNTRDDNDGQDYWVADVIVIETSNETLNYDSISLVYYNPYEQTGYVRYADTLNNEWKNLQPDYEDLAMMGITGGNFTSETGWGDASWSATARNNYDFWFLYRTELTAPGQLSVGSVERITKDWNKYGIYAGVATRIEGLQKSEYVDVSTKLTGCVQNYAIDVDYAEATEVPFYRIVEKRAAYGTIYEAEQINENRTLNVSDVKDGDQLIWVYNKAQNRIAFVIDLGSRNWDNGDTYAAPDWLYKSTENAVMDSPTSLYWKIMKSEGPAPIVEAITVTDIKVKGQSVTLAAGSDSASIDLTHSAAEYTTADDDGVDLTFKTNADAVTVNPVNASTAQNSFATGTWTSDRTDLTGAANAAKTVTYNLFLSKTVSGQPVNRTVTITVNVAAASNNAAVTGVKVKGVEATPVLPAAAGTNVAPIEYNVTVPATVAAGAATPLVVTLADANASISGNVTVNTLGGITTGAYSTLTGAATTAITGTTGDLAFMVRAEDGNTDLYYKVNVTIQTQTAAPAFADKDNAGGDPISELTGSVLTIPAGVTLTTDNVSDYLAITDAAGQTSTATVSGNTITVVTTESGKESRTTTYSWRNETLSIQYAAPTTAKVAGEYDVKFASGIIEVQTSLPVTANVLPVVAEIKSNVNDANGNAPLADVSAVTINTTYVVQDGTTVIATDPATINVGFDGMRLYITSTATVNGVTVTSGGGPLVMTIAENANIT